MSQKDKYNEILMDLFTVDSNNDVCKIYYDNAGHFIDTIKEITWPEITLSVEGGTPVPLTAEELTNSFTFISYSKDFPVLRFYPEYLLNKYGSASATLKQCFNSNWGTVTHLNNSSFYLWSLEASALRVELWTVS